MDEDEVRALPKAEVHVHLEGSISPAALHEFATRYRIELPRPMDELYALDNLADLLDFLDWCCDLVRSPEDVTRVAYDFVMRKKESGIRYADLIFNTTHWPQWRDRLDVFVDSLDAGFAAAERDGGPPVRLCVSILRNQSAAEAMELVQWMISAEHPRIVGLSIDGNEEATGRTAQRFAPAYHSAAEAGLRRTAHAGESSDAEGVWDAIDILQAERIDHGVRAINDPELVAELARREIPLGVCPSSNIKLGVYPSLDAHPLDKLRRAGVIVSVNTDDPVCLEVRLESEYVTCADTFGWDDTVVRSICANSIRASFAEESLKRSLLDELAS
ncbi:MAG: adenosine deaminase [Chloroflexi bacterium]|nr:adenosine deaminase [Chloroflexota bacterium]